MENSNMTRYCERCRETKDITNFKKYGNVCKECKEKQINEQKAKFYSNREQCVCGCYVSGGNPMEKHVQTQSHKNYLTFGHKSGENAVKHFTIEPNKNPNEWGIGYVEYLEKRANANMWKCINSTKNS